MDDDVKAIFFDLYVKSSDDEVNNTDISIINNDNSLSSDSDHSLFKGLVFDTTKCFDDDDDDDDNYESGEVTNIPLDDKPQFKYDHIDISKLTRPNANFQKSNTSSTTPMVKSKSKPMVVPHKEKPKSKPKFDQEKTLSTPKLDQEKTKSEPIGHVLKTDFSSLFGKEPLNNRVNFNSLMSKNATSLSVLPSQYKFSNNASLKKEMSTFPIDDKTYIVYINKGITMKQLIENKRIDCHARGLCKGRCKKHDEGLMVIHLMKPFDNIDNILSLIEKGTPISSSVTTGKNRTISLSVLKKKIITKETDEEHLIILDKVNLIEQTNEFDDYDIQTPFGAYIRVYTLKEGIDASKFFDDRSGKSNLIKIHLTLPMKNDKIHKRVKLVYALDSDYQNLADAYLFKRIKKTEGPTVLFNMKNQTLTHIILFHGNPTQTSTFQSKQGSQLTTPNKKSFTNKETVFQQYLNERK